MMNGWTDRTHVSVASAPQTRDAMTRKTRKSPPKPVTPTKESKERRDLPNDKVKDPSPLGGQPVLCLPLSGDAIYRIPLSHSH